MDNRSLRRPARTTGALRRQPSATVRQVVVEANELRFGSEVHLDAPALAPTNDADRRPERELELFLRSTRVHVVGRSGSGCRLPLGPPLSTERQSPDERLGLPHRQLFPQNIGGYLLLQRRVGHAEDGPGVTHGEPPGRERRANFVW